MIVRRCLAAVPRRAWVGAALVLCAPALASCGDTLQDQPIGPAALETVLVKSHFPAYWLGLKFRGMQISSVTIDPGEAVTIRYGDCVLGGQYTCVTPVSVVSSPDNSFVPGPTSTPVPTHTPSLASTSTSPTSIPSPTSTSTAIPTSSPAPATRSLALRGARASVAQGGSTLAIRTGGVVVSVYARTPALARAAAAAMTPVNEVGLSQAPLPAAQPDTGLARAPLPSQVPAGVNLPRPRGE